MIFGKTKEIQKLKGKIMEAETIIRNLLFDENTSTELTKILINILVVLDKEEAEFILNEYEKIAARVVIPKVANVKKRYNVIGPIVRKRLAQIELQKD